MKGGASILSLEGGFSPPANWYQVAYFPQSDIIAWYSNHYITMITS
jgi:hypothetical protein